jgi:hypothetical protein
MKWDIACAQEGYVEHMKSLLARWTAGTVVIGFGNNESFGGEAGMAQFKKDWEVYLKEIKRLHPDARLVLLSPVAAKFGEMSGSRRATGPCWHIRKQSRKLRTRTEGLSWIYWNRRCAPKQKFRGAWCRTESNSAKMSCGIRRRWSLRVLLHDSSLEAVDPVRVREVAKAVCCFEVGFCQRMFVRPKNGVVYYGVRQRADESATEIPGPAPR